MPEFLYLFDDSFHLLLVLPGINQQGVLSIYDDQVFDARCCHQTTFAEVQVRCVPISK